MNPRKPTQEEINELVEYLADKTNEYVEFEERLNTQYIVVFDKYQTDYPGYKGRVLLMLPTYDLFPEIIDLYVWHEGKITRVRNEEEMDTIVEKNLDKKHGE